MCFDLLMAILVIIIAICGLLKDEIALSFIALIISLVMLATVDFRY